MRDYISPLLLLLIFASCTPKKSVDRSGYVKEQESRELKRVLEADLAVKGESVGNEIITVVAAEFQKKLKRAIVENGINGAVEYCNTNAMDIIKQLEDSLGVSVARVTNQPRNPRDTLSGVEKEIWEAYSYAPQNASTYVQGFDSKNLIVTKPILISSTLCLNCHGTEGSDVTKETAALIREKYPQDQAMGYATGDLRGMWRIILPKKAVVARL